MNYLAELHAPLKVAEDCMHDVSHERTMQQTKDIADLEMSISNCLVLLEKSIK